MTEIAHVTCAGIGEVVGHERGRGAGRLNRGQNRAPCGVVARELDVELVLARVALVDRDVDVGHALNRPEIELEPGAVAVAGPARAEVVVHRAAGHVGVARARRGARSAWCYLALSHCPGRK